jgi:hypothetical protein
MPTLQVWKLRTFQRQLFVKDVVGQERGLKIIDVGIDIRHGVEPTQHFSVVNKQ